MQDSTLIRRVFRGDEEQAEGIVIVIDVIRAFTVAAYAFGAGASSMWLVRTVEEARTLRKRDPAALLAGEIGGRLIPGFDLNNSPYHMARASVAGRRIIQRTGAGTQGAVGARHATHLLVTSLVNARATADYAARLSRVSNLPITLLPTESSSGGIVRNEDKYCADYIEALLTCPVAAPDILSERITQLHNEGRFSCKIGDEDFPVGDTEKILAVNRFHFVMVGKHQEYQGMTYVEVEKRENIDLNCESIAAK